MRRHQWLWAGLLPAAIVLAAWALVISYGNTAPPRGLEQSPATQPPGTVTAREFILVDEAGIERARLSVRDGRTVLSLHRAHGQYETPDYDVMIVAHESGGFILMNRKGGGVWTAP